MKIDELLDKYFEGETSCEEERRLRRFFTEEEVPEHLHKYRPLFACLDREVKALKKAANSDSHSKKPARLYRLTYILGGIAAGVLLLIGIAKILPYSAPPENYVIIDGVRYTDEKLVEAKVLEALKNASFTDEDLNKLLFQH